MKRILIPGVNGSSAITSQAHRRAQHWKLYGTDIKPTASPISSITSASTFRGRHHHQPREWIEYHASATRCCRWWRRDSRDLRQAAAQGVRARLRGEPADRARLRGHGKRLVFPSTSSVSACPSTGSSTRRAHRSSTARSASRAGSTPARSSSWTASSTPTA